MDEISTQQAPAAIGPYAQAVSAGPYVFTSGQIPLRPDGTFVDGSVDEQVQQVLANLDAILTAAGVTRKDVVKATIYLTDLANFERVNQAYGAYFGDHRPARSTVQVAALPRGAAVEIEFIALRP
ncbi:Rid family detoxifying hydrolase [Alicyclobacillus macrosporangiidus]|jgi:2-iminobutanoate/2-iminopropanoate deaminase|uniref:2-iminobutanoate/2-iminopropanoate deaminase n=1 Tax=Alicyclobacillus macrosporangiidus TaxID=392015 RepID=A0A1I7KR74_9BACL|nr:Rid family detoxifying hydrolase [Alicyclobacillus macrosporangiidus]SFU99876.1 2-iminobutanoate/2-iminopropanoate deaminase [Alicyclobacillus macrosporangiidus]